MTKRFMLGKEIEHAIKADYVPPVFLPEQLYSIEEVIEEQPQTEETPE